MRQTTTFEIEDSDYELLKTWVPKDPCINCPNSFSCCGCPESREREKIIKPLKQAGVFEVHQKVQEIKELQQELKKIEKTIAANRNFIASRGFDLNRIFQTVRKLIQSMHSFRFGVRYLSIFLLFL